MAFGFFQRRKKNQEDNPQVDFSMPENNPDKDPENLSDAPAKNTRKVGDPFEQKVERDQQGQLSPADLLPDVCLLYTSRCV